MSRLYMLLGGAALAAIVLAAAFIWHSGKVSSFEATIRADEQHLYQIEVNKAEVARREEREAANALLNKLERERLDAEAALRQEQHERQVELKRLLDASDLHNVDVPDSVLDVIRGSHAAPAEGGARADPGGGPDPH